MTLSHLHSDRKRVLFQWTGIVNNLMIICGPSETLQITMRNMNAYRCDHRGFCSCTNPSAFPKILTSFIRYLVPKKVHGVSEVRHLVSRTCTNAGVSAKRQTRSTRTLISSQSADHHLIPITIRRIKLLKTLKHNLLLRNMVALSQSLGPPGCEVKDCVSVLRVLIKTRIAVTLRRFSGERLSN